MKWKRDHIYVILCIGVILDQFFKFFVRKNMHLLESIPIIPRFFSLTYIENRGAAWGILEDATILLVLIGFGTFYFLLKYIQEEKMWDFFKVLSFGFILSGIVGNLIDRLFYHRVIDYLDFSIFGYNFPVFNFADIMIVVGAIFMILEMVRRKKYAG